MLQNSTEEQNILHQNDKFQPPSLHPWFDFSSSSAIHCKAMLERDENSLSPTVYANFCSRAESRMKYALYEFCWLCPPINLPRINKSSPESLRTQFTSLCLEAEPGDNSWRACLLWYKRNYVKPPKCFGFVVAKAWTAWNLDCGSTHENTKLRNINHPFGTLQREKAEERTRRLLLVL